MLYYYVTNHICLGFSKRFSATTLFGKIFAIPPDTITVQTDVTGVTCLNALWSQYNIQLNSYNQKVNVYDRRVSSYNDANSQAMGIFNWALDIRIWDQVKAKPAKATWDWLKEKYIKSSHLGIMEHFQFLKYQKIDLSDPNPQLTSFMNKTGVLAFLPLQSSTLNKLSYQPWNI